MTCRMIGLLSTLTLSLLVASLAAVAQPAGKVSRIGLLMLSSSSGVSPHIEGFRQGLRDLGWVEGQQIALEYRSAENFDRLPELAADLVRLKADLIVTWGTPAASGGQECDQHHPHCLRWRRQSRRARAGRQPGAAKREPHRDGLRR